MILYKRSDDKISFSNGLIEIVLLNKSGLFSIANDSLGTKITDIFPVINLITDHGLVKIEGIIDYSKDILEKTINDDIGVGKTFLIPYIFSTDETTDFNVKATLIFNLYNDEDFCTLQLVLDMNQPFPSHLLHSLSPFCVENGLVTLGAGYSLNPMDVTFFEHGFQSWSYNKTRFYNETYESIPIEVLARIHQNCDNTIRGDYSSETVTVISSKKTLSSVIIGFITLADCYNRIVMNKLTSESTISFLQAYSQFDNIPLNQVQMNPIKSEELFISFRTDGQGYLGLIKYAEKCSKRMEVVISPEAKTGWCSWYYYYEDISNTELIKNVEFFSENDNIPIKTIQLDDGYFTKVGDFTSFNKKFVNGLSEFVERVHAQGKEAGLWIAPFFASESSELFKKHPDWFLSSKDESPIPVCYNWNEIEYALDLTKIEVQNYIRKLVKTIIEKWGFDFIKIDFVYAASVFGSNYSKKGLTRAQVYRTGLNLIRRAMGDEKYLLGCGAPLGPSVGIVDAMRVSEDTKRIWVTDTDPTYGDACLKYALLNSIYRSFMHNNFWINDPDCLIIRKEGSDLTADEIKLQLTVFALTSGQILISEDMTKLDESQLQLILKVIPAYGCPAVPIDALFEPYPSLYTLFTRSEFGYRLLMAVFNWEDRIISKEVSIAQVLKMNDAKIGTEKVIIFDWWREEILGLFKKEDIVILEKIKPHSCKYLAVIPWMEKDVIPLVSTIHLSQGCLEVKEYMQVGSQINVVIDIPGKHSGKLIFLLRKESKFTDTNLDIIYKSTSWGMVASVEVCFEDNVTLCLNLE